MRTRALILFLLSFVAVAFSQGGPTLETDSAGKQALRYSVAHQHGMSACMGYLYVSATTIRFQSNSEPAHSFEKNRSEMLVAQEWRSLGISMDALELKFSGGGVYHFFHIPESMAHGQNKVLRTNETLRHEPLLEGVNNFDQVLSQLRPPVPAVQLAPAGPPTAEAATLLEKALRYRGGDKLRGVYSYRQRATRTITDQNGATTTYTVDAFVALPDRVHMVITDGKGAKSVYVVNASAAFGIGPDGKRFDIPAYAATNLRAGLRSNSYMTARLQHNGELTAALAGDELVGGTPAAVLELRAGAQVWRWWVDPGSGRLLRSGAEEFTESGGRSFSADDLADFRDVDGINVPYRYADTRGGELTVIEGLEINPVVDPALFYDKPAALEQIAFHPAAAPLAPLVMQGSLRVVSQPTGATVYVDDATKGVTSQSEGLLIVESQTPGTKRVRVTAPGFQEWTKDVEVRAGEATAVEATLVRAGPPPLSIGDVEQMLQGGVSAKRTAILVKERGVDFLLDSSSEQRLRAAGADGDLLLVIAQNKR